MSDKCNDTCEVVFQTTQQQLEKEQTLAAQAKALSHPARLRILHILHTLDTMGGCLNSDLVSELGLAQSTVSEHLRILKQAALSAPSQTHLRCVTAFNATRLISSI